MQQVPLQWDKTSWAAAIAALHIEESNSAGKNLWGSTPITPTKKLTSFTLGALVANAAKSRFRTANRLTIATVIHDNMRERKLAIRSLARLRYRRRNPNRWRYLAL